MTKPQGMTPGIYDGTEMTVLKGNDPGAHCVGTIAMCTRDNVSAQTALSWMMDDRMSYLKPGQFALRYIVQGNVLTFQRNQCVRDMDGDWLLFIDSDMVFQPKAIMEIIATREKFDFDMLGGLCHQRMAPYQPTVYRQTPDGTGYTYLEQWQEGAAVEVDATGMAFCIIHKRVFDRILQKSVGQDLPPLEERRRMPPPPFFRWDGGFGEDFDFCQRAKASGSRIYVDTTIDIGHVGHHIINRETFLREVAFRTDEAQVFRAKQLTGIDEQALTRDTALDELERLTGDTYGLIAAPDDGVSEDEDFDA
jgi:hypothetical protein